MKKNIIIILTGLFISITQFVFAQNVGIGNETPAYKLDVTGVVHNTGNLYTDGRLGVGTVAPAMTLQVNDGNMGLYNSTDAKFWYFNYSLANNYFFLQESPGGTRMVVANGGNVGIGTITPAAKLDVAGAGSFDGDVSVNNGKGIIQNTGGTQLRYRVGGAGLAGTNLAAGGTLSVGFGFSTFSSPPTVYVGNVSGGTGSYLKVLVTISDVTATDCTISVTNVSSSTITFGGTWNIVAIGAE